MSELPNGWSEHNFMEVFDIQGGTQPPKSTFIYEPKEGYIRLLQIRDFGEKPLPTYIPIKKTLKTCNEEDILIARYGASIGRICTGMIGAYNVAMAKVIIPDYMYRKYAYYILRSHIFQTEILKIERSAQDGFNKDDLAKLTIPVPATLNEQKRIVERLELLLGKINKANERLEKIPAILKRFRQSVLSSACSGKLTSDWRVENDCGEWENTILSDVINGKPRNGYSPVGVKYQTPYKNLTLSATTSGKFKKECFKYVDIDISDDSHLWLKTNDILIQRSNSLEYVGICAIYDGSDNEFVYPDIMMKVVANTDKVLPYYLNYALSTQNTRMYYRNSATGTAGNMPKINQDVVMNTPIMLPPLLEQEEIIRRADKLFALADKIEQRYKNEKNQLVRTEKAIYAKAFRGELVRQEGNE